MTDGVPKEILIINPLELVFDKKNQIVRRSLDKDTKEWSPELDTSLPINSSDIPNFKEWVNWNGFLFDRETKKGHNGFDFAAYVTTDNRVVLGLSEDTKIRAVADGVVKQVLDTPEAVGGGYGIMINIEHGADDSGMFSTYVHVRPTVYFGVTVKKGDVIGELYKDPKGDEGRLVHLHLSLVSGWGTRGTSIMGGGMHIRTDDPGVIDPSIYKLNAIPQGSSNFSLLDLPNAKVEIANFKQIRVNSG
ncbi:MAG: hypothetical protein G01um10145_218 [Microgenomates group bacterium Gr01-1014_5]|nr:MAG: hypothetical protein G01um10145_218 [Microgenomates group bacterium Gr01-1014_5]